MRILLFGATGQLAQELMKALTADEVIGLTHAQVDIRDVDAVEKCAERYPADCVVNAAAFHRVDDCEDEVAMSFAVNAVAVMNLVQLANRLRASLVHFSTNYVFDGSERRPYLETDVPNPQSIYALSKLAGEQIVRRYAERYFLIRTAGLYGRAGSKSKQGNFVETMLRLAHTGQPIRVVDDQRLTPTSAKDLAEKMVPLIHTAKYGLYHMTNSGECSWYDFAAETFRLAGIKPDLKPVSSASFGAKARRPAYSVLDNAAFRKAGFADFRPWEEALAEYVRERRTERQVAN
jgi:dTDP-4-dehydrorhamnose reductase